jgi:hypothetical protein
MLIKIAGNTGAPFFCKCSLDLPAAACAGNGPAYSAGVLAVIYSVKGRINRCRTYAEILNLFAARVSFALFEFPAIIFFA